MKKIFTYILTACFLFVLITGCYGKDNKDETKTNAQVESDIEVEKTITDLGGNKLVVPHASKIKNVVVISPPVTSMVLDVIPNKDMIVGLSPKAFAFSNSTLMESIFKEYKDINTTFVDDNFAVNTESLLRLEPDIIFYYGKIQKEGLKNVNVPMVDFFSKDMVDSKEITIAWDNLLRDIFDKDKNDNMESEWNRTENKTAELLNKREGKKEKALCIFSNVNGSLIVSGNSSFDSYAQNFFEKADIENVAFDIDGTAEVDMEQIYKWDPDLIFIFHNVPTKAYLNNTIKGQDWSLLNAWENKKIYDIPQTTYSWGAPCADSPMMPLWLISKAYPELLSEQDFKTELIDYYKRYHNVSLNSDIVESILKLRDVKE